MAEERRLVTVLFSDVVDSTGLGERLDAEEVRSLLAGYFEVAKAVLTDHGGSLEKFIGDAVVGVFGIPQAHGDDPKRAIDAAIELRDRLRTDDQLRELSVRFGLATGEVVTTRGAGADFFIGDAVNVAARLQQAAGPWAILAAERTIRSVSGAFALGPRVSLELKGKTAPVAAYEVRGRNPIRAQPSAPVTPFQGREDELAELRIVAQRAFRERRPAFVSIIAPAGTGKTRLLQEFLGGHLPKLAVAPRIATAQCLPYGRQLTYWPLRQMLFSLLSLTEDATSGEVRNAIAGWMPDSRAASLVALSIGSGEGEASDRSDVFVAWRTAIETAASASPLILVFEDLHWSSDSLLDLVEFVTQPRGEASVLMVGLARPDLMDRRPNWGGGRRNFLNLFLEPLADEEMRSLVAAMLPDEAALSADQIISQAEGNPFYAEELVRSVLEQGPGAGLPDSVQATVLARIDQLLDDERHLVQLGSIFGRSFRISGIRALAPDLSAIDAAAERLLAGDLVKRGTEDHLEFRHILIREVAYQTLTRAERARLHAAAGQWLESRTEGREDAMAEIIAFHFRESLAMLGRQRPPGFDEPVVRRKAVLWLGRAGDTAAAAGAPLEASKHFRAAVALASEDELPELYERLGDVEQLRAGSIDAYRRALDLCRAMGRPANQQLRVLGGLLMCVQRWWEGVGRMEQAELEALRDLGRRLEADATDDRAIAKYLAADAFYAWHMHRQSDRMDADVLRNAEAAAKRAVELAERAGDVNAWSAALDAVAGTAEVRADWEASFDASSRRLSRRMELSKIERRDAYHMVCDASICLGNLSAAQRIMEEANSLDWGPLSPEALAIMVDQLYVIALLGRWDDVLALAREAINVWNETHGASGPASYGFVTAYEVAIARRDTQMIEALHDILVKIADEVRGGPYLRAVAAREWTEIEALMVTDVAGGQAGEGKIERALGTMLDRGQSLRPETLERLLMLATRRRLPLLEAQVRRGLADFDAAIGIWEGAGARPYVARARIERALAAGDALNEKDVSVIRQLGDLQYAEFHGLVLGDESDR